MTSVRNVLYALGALSVVPNAAAVPLLDNICLPLGIDLGGIFDLFEAPLVTEVVPYFAVSTTAVPSAGVYTVGSSCFATTVTCQGPTDISVTQVSTKTTTYPCSTSTRLTSTWWDHCGGSTTSATCQWTPPATYPASTTTVTATVTDTVTSTVTDPATSCSTPTPPPTLSCDPYGYLIQFATLYRVDLTTGNTIKVKSGLGANTSINAIGYNIKDNLIYGSQDSTLTIIRIAADGTSSTVAGVSAPPPSSNVGDIDSNGHYWVSSAGKAWAEIDLDPSSPTYGQTLANGTAAPFGLGVADWVYIPIAGDYLYAVGSNSTSGGASMIRFDMATYAWQKVANYPNLPVNGFGAIYGMNNGTLYASDNTSGEIWQFPISGAAPFKLSQGPASGNNDGARCVWNLLS
jgi:hypothetical protein